MVETSPFLRKMQMKNLCAAPNIEGEEPKLKQAYKSKHSASISVTWLEDISEVPRKDTAHFVLANEFFDALPIQKFQVTSLDDCSSAKAVLDKTRSIFDRKLRPGSARSSSASTARPTSSASW